MPLLPSEEQRRDFRKACLNMALLPIFQADESVVLIQLDNAPNLLKVYLDQALS
ncbi:hypothetical protein [Endozoicomonas sp. 2B-B]